MPNLAARILTASVLGSAVVAGVVWLPFSAMAGFFALALFIAALEWAALVGIAGRPGRIGYGLSTLVLAAATFLVSARAAGVPLALACGWWWVATLWVIHYQLRGWPAVHNPWLLCVCGWLVLVPAMIALLHLLGWRPPLLLALFALVWSADILAYFGGKALGRTPLASRVSPGKTWEGLAIALVGTLLLAAFGAHWLVPQARVLVLPVVALTLVAAVIGDLLESLLKRMRGVKDSGHLLPGHGGVLDRIDSLLAAAPVFTLGVILLERP